MPRTIPAKCKDCGKPRTARRHVSRNGLCSKCATVRQTKAAREQATTLAAMHAAGQLGQHRDTA